MNNNRFAGRSKLRFLLFPSILALLSLVVMLLWNAILPNLLHVRIINYWQAAGLLILCKILFGGMPGGRFRNAGSSAWRNKFKNMTDEDREKLKAEWQKRCHQRKQQND